MIVQKDSKFYSVDFDTQTYTECVFPEGANIEVGTTTQTYRFVRTIDKICCFKIYNYVISCYYSDDEINWKAASFNGNSVNVFGLSTMKYQTVKDNVVYVWDETYGASVYEIDLDNDVLKTFNMSTGAFTKYSCINLDINDDLIFTYWNSSKNNFHYCKLNKTSNAFEDLSDTITYNATIDDAFKANNDCLITTDSNSNKYYPTSYSSSYIRGYILNIPITLNDSNYLNANSVLINKPFNNMNISGIDSLIAHTINNKVKYSSIFLCQPGGAFVNSYSLGNVPLMLFPTETYFNQSDTSLNAYIINDKYIYNIYSGFLYISGNILRYFDLSSIDNEIQSLKIPDNVNAVRLYDHYFFLPY